MTERPTGLRTSARLLLNVLSICQHTMRSLIEERHAVPYCAAALLYKVSRWGTGVPLVR